MADDKNKIVQNVKGDKADVDNDQLGENRDITTDDIHYATSAGKTNTTTKKSGQA